MGGGRDINEASNRLGLPADLLQEAEGFDDVGVYPDNMQIVSTFNDMLTQWRTGASGVTGLDYNALPVVMRFRRVKVADREEVFDGVRIMESAALAEIRRKR